MILYRCITGKDDAEFCHRVTAALNKGWSLHGSPSLTYDQDKKSVICAQSITKEIAGLDYDSSMKLGEY